jgi:hypothetical protein
VALKVINQDLIVLSGGTPASGSMTHYPVWIDDEGNEFLYVNGEIPVMLKNFKGKIIRRETVIR